MKLPFMSKQRGPRQFNITPRHYDPIKEEIEQRTKRIKAELKAEGLLKDDEEGKEEVPREHSSPIRGAFTRGGGRGGSLTRQSNSGRSKTGLLRLIILLILVGALGGYIYIGPKAVGYMLLVALGWVAIRYFSRLKGRRAK